MLPVRVVGVGVVCGIVLSDWRYSGGGGISGEARGVPRFDPATVGEVHVNQNPRIDPHAPVFGGVPSKLLQYTRCNRCGEREALFSTAIRSGSYIVHKIFSFGHCNSCGSRDMEVVAEILSAERVANG